MEKRKRFSWKTLLVVGVVLLLVLAGAGGALSYWFYRPSKVKKPKPLPKPQVALAARFAVWRDTPVNVTPKIKLYQVNSDLSNVTNRGDFTMSDSTKEILVKNAFVASPKFAGSELFGSSNPEFFPIYEDNRYLYIPNFITTDSIVHTYHLFFNYLLERIETESLAPELKKLNAEMLKVSQDQHDSLKGTSWENAAKRNVAFFAVGGKLLDSSVSVPDYVSNEVSQELGLIDGHEGIELSPIINMGKPGVTEAEGLKEDYTQYIPRGHYAKSDTLKAYFKSMMWYGRMTFRLKDEDETRSAILVTQALASSSDASRIFDKLYETTTFFVGKSDDITYYDYRNLLTSVYGKKAALKQITSTDKSKLSAFVRQANRLEPPKVNSIPIFSPEIANKEREKEIKGFRFMGQRFTIDASIMQRLVWREVGTVDKKRMLPKGLDVPAAMDSEEALNILKGAGETDYANYSENMSKTRKYIKSLKQDVWTQNLYWGWLYSILSLTQQKGEGYPSFMTNQAWLRKDLNTYLGSWTELKHDTILYAKQVYAELGGEAPKQKDDRGYVEPDPYLYARLKSLITMTKEGLEDRGFLSSKNKESLEKMETLVLSLKTISEKELKGEEPTKEEYDLIRTYGGSLEHFWHETLSEEEKRRKVKSVLQDNPAPLVADVATDPNGTVLEEATGWILPILVVVPVGGELRIAKGGIYSYYEFTQPMNQRLTDEEWRKMIKEGKIPDRPKWADLFTQK